jgi:hypothetical protein
MPRIAPTIVLAFAATRTGTPTTQSFLDDVIDRRRRQAEANQKNPGYRVFTTKPPAG